MQQVLGVDRAHGLQEIRFPDHRVRFEERRGLEHRRRLRSHRLARRLLEDGAALRHRHPHSGPELGHPVLLGRPRLPTPQIRARGALEPLVRISVPPEGEILVAVGRCGPGFGRLWQVL